jgi:glycosyltransferase involved in cell wall biosynthesis
VTVLLAVHDGGRFLEQTLESIAGLDYPQELINVLVISDGFTVETDIIARKLPKI